MYKSRNMGGSASLSLNKESRPLTDEAVQKVIDSIETHKSGMTVQELRDVLNNSSVGGDAGVRKAVEEFLTARGETMGTSRVENVPEVLLPGFSSQRAPKINKVNYNTSQIQLRMEVEQIRFDNETHTQETVGEKPTFVQCYPPQASMARGYVPRRTGQQASGVRKVPLGIVDSF